jgi:hypothetical protein
MPSSEPLYALTCTENLIAVGGASSTLTVFDTRKWALRTHWKNCLKYEILYIHFSTVHRELCYVAGGGSEVAHRITCNRAKKKISNISLYIASFCVDTLWGVDWTQRDFAS